jgi:hypothetical protein
MAERIRRQFSMKRLHRCEACRWRGWGLETQKPASAEDYRDSDGPAPDLESIDRAFGTARTKPDEQPRS